MSYTDIEVPFFLGFPGGSDGKVSAYSVGDLGLIPGMGRSSGEGNDNPLQYSCLENPMDGGASVHGGREKSDTTERLHFLSFLFSGLSNYQEVRWCPKDSRI